MRILVFIGLKIMELFILVFVPFRIGKLVGQYEETLYEESTMLIWVTGFATLLAVSAVIAIIVLLCVINWDWANKIIRRKP